MKIFEENKIRVLSAHFHGVVRALEELGEDVCSLEDRVSAMCRFFSENGHTLQEAIPLGKACKFRMETLLRLRNGPGMLEQDTSHGEMLDDGCDLYLVAAAEEPLIGHGWNEFAFDRARFRARVLSIRTKQRGTAVQAPS